jgi:site-specific DNA-methyltransferase (adenine-specific)
MWDIPSTPTLERKYGKHPSQKPVGVVLKLIKGFTKQNDIIIDPFAGSGTIPLTALRLKRRFIAIDNNKEYCQIMLKRIKNLGIDYPKGLF